MCAPGENPPLSFRGGKLRLAISALCLAANVCSSDAQALISPAPAGQVEAGVPPFTVLGPETLGLSAAPTDLKLLPDGRILLTAQREIAFGDGVRWESFRGVDGQSPVHRNGMVDSDGTVYVGTEGAIGRLQLIGEGLWQAVRETMLPSDARVRSKTMVGAFSVGSDWYWHAGTGNIVAWRPGQTARVIPNTADVSHVFRLGSDVYVSDSSSGALLRLSDEGGGGPVEVSRNRDQSITASVPFGPDTVLVGTTFAGLGLFDGTNLRAFGFPGPLTSGLRINDVCAAGPDCFAAAIDLFGVAFFDRNGRVIQTLEAKLDHRLARVERLRYSPDGVLWMLLNEGIARVEYPSRVSRFEPLIAGLTYAHPVRHNQELWMLADGRALRGIYDQARRLQRFESDSPPGRYVFTLTSADDDLFAATEDTIYVRENATWTPVLRGITNARVGIGRHSSGALVYCARGEIGLLTKTSAGYTARRIPIPSLGESYNAWSDAAGMVWLELGNSYVGRVDLRTPEPAVSIFGPEAGLTDGWVAIFIFEGVARFQQPYRSFVFDERKSQFVQDQALLRRFPQFLSASSRPVVDRRNHVWYAYDGVVWKLDLTARDAEPLHVPLPFMPTELTFEEDDVMWFFGNRRLGRYDPNAPDVQPDKPRVVITSMEFPNSKRREFALDAIAPIDYADNTIGFHFASPGNAFASPVSFETQLGTNSRWVSAGNTGQAVFNRLKEGTYTFRVRAVTNSGVGSEIASVQFVINPPWFRSFLAWLAYILGGIGLLLFATWYPALRQRQISAQLEKLVAVRTEELHNTNQQLGSQMQETTEKSRALAASEERYRVLSGELEQRVEERTAELSHSNRELQQRESLFRLIFEHAPVGISWKRADLDNVHHFNETYRRILSLPGDSLTDYTLLTELVHPDDAPRQALMLQRIQRGDVDSYQIEERFVLKDGREVWGSLSVAVIRDDSGRIVQDIGILEDITARKQAEQKLAVTYKELLDASRTAGMAEVATGVLHNVGNVLNSLNVSSNLISSTVRQSRTESLSKLAALLDEHAGDLGSFLTDDAKGRRVPELLAKLAAATAAERDWLLQEISSMQKNIDHIKDIVAMQQSYATVVGVLEALDAGTLMDDALRMNSAALSRHDVQIVREFLPVPPITVEKGKVLQILTNLIRNAKYACDDGQKQYGIPEKVITVRVEEIPGNRVRFTVRDNGIGIPEENLTRIFAHGFTTRSYGHGFGLHSSALAAREMKGSLIAHSEGLGCGATFRLEVPIAAASLNPTVTA